MDPGAAASVFVAMAAAAAARVAWWRGLGRGATAAPAARGGGCSALLPRGVIFFGVETPAPTRPSRVARRFFSCWSRRGGGPLVLLVRACPRVGSRRWSAGSPDLAGYGRILPVLVVCIRGAFAAAGSSVLRRWGARAAMVGARC